MERILGLPSDTVAAVPAGQTLAQDSAQVVPSSRASDAGTVPGDTLAPAELVFAPADSSAASYVVSQAERDSLRRRDAQIKAALASLYGISLADTESELGPKTLADTLMAADAYQAKVYESLPQPTQPPYVKIATPVRFTLDNGLKVLVYPDSSIPIVTFYIGISNHRVFEKDKKGVSDLTAAMLLAGVQNRTKAQITDSLANMGSRYRMTRSSFYVSGLSRYAAQNFNLFADVVLAPFVSLAGVLCRKTGDEGRLCARRYPPERNPQPGVPGFGLRRESAFRGVRFPPDDRPHYGQRLPGVLQYLLASEQCRPAGPGGYYRSTGPEIGRGPFPLLGKGRGAAGQDILSERPAFYRDRLYPRSFGTRQPDHHLEHCGVRPTIPRMFFRR